MKNVFTFKTNAKVHPNDIVVRYHKTSKYDDTGLKVLYQIPINIKSEISLLRFRNKLIQAKFSEKLSFLTL